tara:strand:- start:1082 stop:1492 length:411 start_codon:yes stop_codon:yes gene_type:complete
MIGLATPLGHLPGGGEEIAGLSEEAMESLLPLFVTEAGGQFLERGLPEFLLEEGLQGITTGKGQAARGEITDHEELPGTGVIRSGGRIVQPEGEFLERAFHLQADKAEADVHLGGAFAEFPVGFVQILLDSGGQKL